MGLKLRKGFLKTYVRNTYRAGLKKIEAFEKMMKTP